jgi:hypothetical protein
MAIDTGPGYARGVHSISSRSRARARARSLAYFNAMIFKVRAVMVLAALFRLQSSSCETECNFGCNCMYISMSYRYCMYEFVGPNPARLRGVRSPDAGQ